MACCGLRISGKSKMKTEFINRGTIEYQKCLEEMLELVKSKPQNHVVWYLEHPPVFTLGISEKEIEENLDSNPPIFKTDRGGKITYHGLGQTVFYFILNLKKTSFKPSEVTKTILTYTSNVLSELKLDHKINVDDPGIYVEGEKLASIGMRIKNHFSYHGISINYDTNLKEFNSINPCGLEVRACNLCNYIDIKKDKFTNMLIRAYKQMLQDR